MKNNDFGIEQKRQNAVDASLRANASCERTGDELVAYLYGEASETEAESFAAHMQDCEECRTEYVSFNSVRESIGAWRKEALGFSHSAAAQSEHAFISESNAAASGHARAAFAALREFFSLSPAWMRFSTAFATLAVCALAAIGVANIANAEFSWNAKGVALRTHVSPVRLVEKRIEVAKPVKTGYSEEELNARVEERVQRKLAEIKLEEKSQQTFVATSAPASMARAPMKRNAPYAQTIAANAKQPAVQERYNTASSRDKRVEIAEERDLPRLSDLLNEGNDR